MVKIFDLIKAIFISEFGCPKSINYTEFHFKKMKEKLCEHKWIIDEHNGAKRTCSKCKRHEWLYGHGSTLYWEVMPFGERK